MRRGRLTEDQIIGVLREHEAGVKTAELCRKHGISDATFYNWKSKYGGMSASDLKRLREMEEEMSKLKRMYADLAMENRALKDLIEKKLGPPEKRGAISYLLTVHAFSIRRGCQSVGISRAAYYRNLCLQRPEDQAVIDALNTLVEKRPRWGFLEMLQGAEKNEASVEPQACLPRLLWSEAESQEAG